MVERFLGKEEVAGSIPALGSGALKTTDEVGVRAQRQARRPLGS